MARNNAPGIAPDFGSYSRRIEGCILIVCAPQCNAEYGPKDKQDGRIIFCHVPYYHTVPVRENLPRAKVVVDRFHVMKQLNTRLTQLRTKYQKQCDPETQKILKGSRWIIVRNRSELSRKQLDQILELCPELRIMYLLKEEFRTIFEKVKCRDKAARFLDTWCLKAERTGDKYLAKVLHNTLIPLAAFWIKFIQKVNSHYQNYNC
ncbi:MAG: transposase [Desulfobacterales bacterium]